MLIRIWQLGVEKQWLIGNRNFSLPRTAKITGSFFVVPLCVDSIPKITLWPKMVIGAITILPQFHIPDSRKGTAHFCFNGHFIEFAYVTCLLPWPELSHIAVLSSRREWESCLHSRWPWTQIKIGYFMHTEEGKDGCQRIIISLLPHAGRVF